MKQDQIKIRNQGKKINKRVCPHTLAFILDNPLRKLFFKSRKIFGEYIKEGDTVLDFGCGPGFFTVDMAGMVGRSGRVIAIDLQEKMLEHVKKKAAKKGLSDIIKFHCCSENKIGVNQKVNFILAYYVVHETPSAENLLKQFYNILKERGKVLIVEPSRHVSRENFTRLIKEAEKSGFTILGSPRKAKGRSLLLAKG